jgi:ubiquitin carboxyl-terminal hydrolase 7
MLSGQNQYMAEGHGMQDAQMGCRIKSLPPVLELQLKRFEYNPMMDAMCKINDKFIFPPEIDLSDFLAEDADRTQPAHYSLYAYAVAVAVAVAAVAVAVS